MPRDKTYPDRTIEEAMRKAHFPVRVNWEVRGPKDTQVAWITCLLIGPRIVLVQTYERGGWEVFIPADDTNKTADAIKAVGDFVHAAEEKLSEAQKRDITKKLVETYHGFPITYLWESGYAWRNGSDGGGFFDTLAEARADIDDYEADLDAKDRAEGRTPEDARVGSLEDTAPAEHFTEREASANRVDGYDRDDLGESPDY